jgi:biopolymer transport protein ExbD/biopolymer transport protein TolR
MAAHQHHGADTVREASKLKAASTMNITPMIDVLLVLLVIFMAALPLSQRGIDVNLPAETTPREVTAPPEQIVLSYTAERLMSINTIPVTLPELEPRLREIFETRREKTLFIMGAERFATGKSSRSSTPPEGPASRGSAS